MLFVILCFLGLTMLACAQNGSGRGYCSPRAPKMCKAASAPLMFSCQLSLGLLPWTSLSRRPSGRGPLRKRARNLRRPRQLTLATRRPTFRLRMRAELKVFALFQWSLKAQVPEILMR